MKQKRKILWILIGVGVIAGIFSIALLISCVGPPGPQGPPGPLSEASRCKDCHNDKTSLLAKKIQVETSLHYQGDAFSRSTKDCAICHSSEGFTERINSNNLTAIKADILDPTPPNCRTCHYIHATYGIQDYALRTTKPVKLELTGTVVDLGKGNLCANCHQPRWTDKPPAATETGEIQLASSRYGPHHGVQSAVIAGVASYGAPFTGTSVHYKTVQDSCITCHMGNAVGDQSGGHTFRVSFTSETGSISQNLSGCKTCHKDITTFDRDKAVTEVIGLIAELKKALIAKGILVESTGLAKTGKYPAKLVGAYWNYLLVTEDRSNGIHNPQFVTAILKSSIEAAK